MRRVLIAAGALLALTAGGARAVTITDPTNDFLPSFVGDHDPDLDVTSFTVDYDATAQEFLLSATLAGAIDPAKPGLYVIGVNTGTGAIKPFAGIGEPNVIFNQAIVVMKTGAATLGANTLGATIVGDMFGLVVPVSLLPSTGFAPSHYGFNLWPRNGLGDNSQISDFAPQNATLAAVPEPAVWSMLIGGFGLVGAALRRRRSSVALLA